MRNLELSDVCVALPLSTSRGAGEVIRSRGIPGRQLETRLEGSDGVIYLAPRETLDGKTSGCEVPRGWLWLTDSRRVGVNHSRGFTEMLREFEIPSGSVPIPTPLFRPGVPTLAGANRESPLGQDGERRSWAVGNLRRSSWSRAPGAGVHHLALRVASHERQWLPDPNGFANSEKREQSALTVAPGHVSFRRSVPLGVRAERFCELWRSLVNRGRLGSGLVCGQDALMFHMPMSSPKITRMFGSAAAALGPWASALVVSARLGIPNVAAAPISATSAG